MYFMFRTQPETSKGLTEASSGPTRKSIIQRAQEHQLNGIEEVPVTKRVSKRVSIREDLENKSPNTYNIFKPELVKKLSNKSFDEADDEG